MSFGRRSVARTRSERGKPGGRAGPLPNWSLAGHLRREARRRARSESPIANAFCRTAPSVRLSLRPMILAGVLCRAKFLSSRLSRDDHSRRATRLFAGILSISNRLLIALYCALWPKSDHQARRNNNRKAVKVW